MSTALLTSVPSSNALTLFLPRASLLAAWGTVAISGEDRCGGGVVLETKGLVLEVGELAGVGCLDLCNCSSVLLGMGMDIGVDDSDSRSNLSVDIRKGLLPCIGTTVDATEAVEEPEEVDEFEAAETSRFPSPNRPNAEGRTSSALAP